jgi:lysophospholipid acyltransferase (LPLAT)-like uncharacterized protein
MSEAPVPIPRKPAFAGWVLSLIMRLVFFTSRKRYTNPKVLRHHFDGGQSFILVAWHNRNLFAPFGYLAHASAGRRFRPLASASKDGSIAAAAMRGLGVECIRGSSSRGGSAALRQMLKAARRGDDLGITPDGPRGPKYVVQPGVVAAARMTGLPIIAMSCQARRKKILRSWDAMIVPYPFNRLHYAYSEPIAVARDADDAAMEQVRLEVERELMRLGEIVEAV